MIVGRMLGANALAAYTTTTRLEQLVQQPFGSLSMALSTYSGQNMGAKKMDRLRSGFRSCMLATMIIAGFMVLLMQLFNRELIGLFVREEAVISLGSQALKITSVFYIFLGIIYASRGILNGVGDAFFSLLNGMVEIVGRVGLPLLLLRLLSPEMWLSFERAAELSRLMANSPSAEVWVIWITAGLTWLLAAIFCMLRYFSWRRKNILPRTAKELRLSMN